MTNLAVTLMVSDTTLRAIGHVAAQWAYFETEFDIFLNQLLRHPKTKHLVSASMPQAFDRRAALFRKCATILLKEHPKLLHQIVRIINDACSVRGHRDNVIHGQWHPGRRGTAVTVIRARPKFSARERHMSDPDIEEIAAQISVVTARLIWWREMNVDYGG